MNEKINKINQNEVVIRDINDIFPRGATITFEPFGKEHHQICGCQTLNYLRIHFTQFEEICEILKSQGYKIVLA